MSLSRRSRREVRAFVLFSVSLHCALHCVACSGSDAETGAAAPDAAAGGWATGGASGGDSSGGGGRPEPGGRGGASAPGDAGPAPTPVDDGGPGPEPDPGDDAGPTPGPDAAGPVPDAAAPGPDPRLATLIDEAAAAVCGALFRCCDDGSVNRYFEPYVYNEALEDFVPRLPPRAEVTAETCPGLVAEMLTVVPLGRWVDAAERGLVELVPARVDACLDALASAACGEGVSTALFDAACFWLNPPAGGDEQRTIFARTATEGAACRPLNDGFGGVFFGTCDPELAFCCHGEPGACDFPDGPESEGICRPAGAIGDACSQLPVQLCRTGLECGDDGLCRAPVHTPLSVGDPCIDERFNLLGDCVDSYCDVFESSRCVPRRADGEACMGPDECLSFACLEGVCADPQFCQGR